MLAPKKGLLCNLNHIHLQHISLGLHLSRHPELQDTDGSTGGGDQTGCTQCPENHEPVDANSNNPSVKCRCCESHAPEPETLGLQNQAVQEDFPCLHSGDEEEAASPCDPPCDLDSSSSSSSSSVSSCSDFSLDDSPVSVYCKSFSREESQSPDKQLNVIPIENARDGEALADQDRTCDGRDANHNSPVLQRATAVASKSPDSLCSNNSLDSHCDELSPTTAAHETSGTCADLDPNCNPLPEPDAAPPAPPPVPERRDPKIPGSATEPRPRPAGLPPPVPPRPRRRLQILNAHRAEQPLGPVRPAEPKAGPGELCRDTGTKTITSFHELAQRRKRNVAGPTPAQARVDRSDWLIVFSPDTELPPTSELLSGPAGQEPARPQPQPNPQLQQDGPARPPGSRQREVTTFKELRSRSAARQPKGQRAEPAQHPPVPPAPLGGQVLAPSDGHQLRRRPRPSLQPIAEGQPRDVEKGGLPPGEKGLGTAPLRRLGGPGGDPAVPRAAQRGDETCLGRESGSLRGGPGSSAWGGCGVGCASPGAGSDPGRCRGCPAPPRGSQRASSAAGPAPPPFAPPPARAP